MNIPQIYVLICKIGFEKPALRRIAHGCRIRPLESHQSDTTCTEAISSQFVAPAARFVLSHSCV